MVIGGTGYGFIYLSAGTRGSLGFKDINLGDSSLEITSKDELDCDSTPVAAAF